MPDRVTIEFFEDAGHGWAEVERAELEALGIAGDISSYSYQQGSKVYLEEDSDLTKYANARRLVSTEINWNNHYQETSNIRNMEAYKPSA